MADIKQAAKWMQEGKRVVRARSDYAHYSVTASGPVMTDFRTIEPAVLLVTDLLADDWEIAE